MEKLKVVLMKESFRLARKIVRDAMAAEAIPLTDESELLATNRLADGIRQAATGLTQTFGPVLPPDYWTRSDAGKN